MHRSSIMLSQLQANRLLRNQEELQKFIEALNYIRSHSARGSGITADDFLMLFDDSAVNIPPLNTLIAYLHAAYTKEEFIEALLRITPTNGGRARGWLTMFYSGVITNREANDVFKDKVRHMDDAIRQILKDISAK